LAFSRAVTSKRDPMERDFDPSVPDGERRLKVRRPALDWLERVIGSMKDEPAFNDVLAYRRAIRQADVPADDQLP
jgi:hypothetical protein